MHALYNNLMASWWREIRKDVRIRDVDVRTVEYSNARQIKGRNGARKSRCYKKRVVVFICITYPS